MTSNAENPCLARGCAGACCTDMTFDHMSPAQMDLIKNDDTPVVEVPDVMTSGFYQMVGRRRQRGGEPPKTTKLYFSPDKSGGNTVLLVGPCVNLQNDGSCGIYDKRPPQCRTFEVGSPVCDATRRGSPKGGTLFIGNIQKRPGMKG